MNEKEVESLLKETKAILEGHFLLTSGLHSPLYVEKFNVLQHPEYTEKLCQEFANHFKDMGIETVIGPRLAASFCLRSLRVCWAFVPFSPKEKMAR